jgi:hypothetical protein
MGITGGNGQRNVLQSKRMALAWITTNHKIDSVAIEAQFSVLYLMSEMRFAGFMLSAERELITMLPVI